MKFKPIVNNPRVQQTFDLNFKVKQKGKEFNLYDSIQEARVDTEIYEVLEKYNCIPKHFIDHGKVYDDFRELGDLKDMKLADIKAQQMWDDLPWEIRKEFNNDKHLFVKDGQKYLEKKIAEMTPKTPVETPVVNPGGEVAGTINTPSGGNL